MEHRFTGKIFVTSAKERKSKKRWSVMLAFITVFAFILILLKDYYYAISIILPGLYLAVSRKGKGDGRYITDTEIVIEKDYRSISFLNDEEIKDELHISTYSLFDNPATITYYESEGRMEIKGSGRKIVHNDSIVKQTDGNFVRHLYVNKSDAANIAVCLNAEFILIS